MTKTPSEKRLVVQIPNQRVQIQKFIVAMLLMMAAYCSFKSMAETSLPNFCHVRLLSLPIQYLLFFLVTLCTPETKHKKSTSLLLNSYLEVLATYIINFDTFYCLRLSLKLSGKADTSFVFGICCRGPLLTKG